MKAFSKLVLAGLLALGVNAAADTKVIKIGATPVPHAEILEEIKPLLKEQGYTLDIKVFNDYVIPNLAVNDGELDANFFQHIPYMDDFNAKRGTTLVKTVGVHLEPMGVYSKKIKTLDELKSGDSVAIPNDPTNRSRALDVLATAGLIKLKDVSAKTPLDIVENPKKLKFTELDAAQLPRTLDDVTISVINTNYALNAGLNPTKDALVIESSESPYVNIVTVKKGNETKEAIKALNNAITSKTVKNFIQTKYKGSIVPAF